MKAKELRKKTIKELRKMEMDLREQLRELKFALASGKVKNVRKIREIKRDIARILTVIREKLTKQ
jgi:large subunit ribosomal protein L29